ncbi:hypothetical protein [Clostridium ganghwense]|uniref:DUF2178 domain-containing protein n=1 Tax=Clostridium ganghwense TaxID=312089 RepID=A0ABT4CQB4_9CLOT|nr:hypothetical protein [Clostridium ganghwense]MCY6370648.1 hypothetical protein [Clostridium ganghwense]
MKKKIYNTKGFWSGIVSLCLAMVGMFFLIPSYYNDMKMAKMIKSIIGIILLLAIGFTSINRSLDYKKTREDEQQDDEREKFIVLKASQTSLKITQYFCCALMIILMIVWYFTKINGIIGMIVGLGIIWNISIFSDMIAYFYHDKRN